MSPNWAFRLRSSHQTFAFISYLPIRATYPSHPPHPMLARIQVTKLLIMRFVVTTTSQKTQGNSSPKSSLMYVSIAPLSVNLFIGQFIE
jgi:hypothetical protein